MSTSSSSSGGIGLAGILTIIFALAKIFGVVHWSWFWVFSPIIISVSLSLVILFAVLVIGFLVAMFDH